MTTTPDPIAAIERALEGVTPGPWKVFDGCSWRRIGTTGRNGHDCAVLAPTKASDGHPDLTCAPGNDLYANLNYIAACNPVAITALLSLARQAAEKDAEIARLREALKPFAEEAGCYDPDTGDSDDSVWATPVYFKIRDLRRARTLLEDSDAPHD